MDRGGESDARETAWSVVMLAREPAPLVLANLAWHLAAGAKAVHLYLDDPRDPVAEAAAALPNVTVIRCDRAFWQRLAGNRPALQTRRQSLVATEAYRATATGWMLHLDADEFLWPATGLAAALGQMPPSAQWLHLPVRERCFLGPDTQTLFDGGFLAPLPQGTPPADPERARYLARGLTAHAAGKGCTRCGQDAELLPHAPRLRGERPPSERAAQARILHFDGLTRLHWLLKLLRYADHPPGQWERFLGAHRQAQLHYVRAHRHDPGALRAFHDMLKCCMGDKGGRAEKLAFDPVPAMRRYLTPVPGIDSAGFDEMLRRADPERCVGL